MPKLSLNKNQQALNSRTHCTYRYVYMSGCLYNSLLVNGFVRRRTCFIWYFRSEQKYLLTNCPHVFQPSPSQCVYIVHITIRPINISVFGIRKFSNFTCTCRRVCVCSCLPERSRTREKILGCNYH